MLGAHTTFFTAAPHRPSLFLGENQFPPRQGFAVLGWPQATGAERALGESWPEGADAQVPDVTEIGVKLVRKNPFAPPT